MSHRLYHKVAIQTMDRLLNGQPVRKSLHKFPLNFCDSNISSPKDYPFYSKYLVDKTYKSLFEQLLYQLTDRPQLPQSNKRIQPNLLQKLKQNQAQSGMYLDIKQLDIVRIQTIDELIVKGMFIHRNLNLPDSCFSVQKIVKAGERSQLVYRLRSKLQRKTHIGEWMEKKDKYESEDNRYYEFYMDGYENFIATEQIMRFLLVVSCRITGSVRSRQGTVIQLPWDANKPVTTHLLQVESPHLFGKKDETRFIVTDIDDFMKGNPYAV